jgi:hypothetical protein
MKEEPPAFDVGECQKVIFLEASQVRAHQRRTALLFTAYLLQQRKDAVKWLNWQAQPLLLPVQDVG